MPGGEAFLAYRYERTRWLIDLGAAALAVLLVLFAAAFSASFVWPQK